MADMMNGDQPEPLNSRTRTFWLRASDFDYLAEVATELGLLNQDGKPNRNRALRVILESHQANRRRRLAKK